MYIFITYVKMFASYVAMLLGLLVLFPGMVIFALAWRMYARATEMTEATRKKYEDRIADIFMGMLRD